MTQTTIYNDGTYGIDTGNGTQITAGVSGYDILRVAQCVANERGETVYVYECYEMPADDEDDQIAVEPLAVDPDANA